MNFKRFGRTANLFDEANLEGGVYLASNGNKYGSITDGVRSGVKINALPNTPYTLSLYSNTNISISILQWSGETYITHTPKYNVSGNISLTIITNSTTDKIAFNVEGANGQYVENLMLNEGSTALPYQPYMDWTNAPHYIHNTSTDTITTLPADIYANDTTATVGLKGDMEQSGTPTPTTPLQPHECGERTGNLLNPTLIMTNKAFNTVGAIIDYEGYACSGYVPVEPSTTYVRNCNGVAVGNVVLYFTNGKTLINRAEPGAGGPFTTPSNCAFVGFSFNMENYDMNSYALNTTPNIPFEPYGYKIPILNNSQTTNVYLGEVQSTRRIKKLALKGDDTETYTSSYSGDNRFFNYTLSSIGQNVIISTHFTIADISSTSTDVGVRIVSGTNLRIRPENVSGMSVDGFKTWLSTQYAAGTPVTVWYVLAEPETAVLNEPLRKIGDYADTVSGITIPTIAGANTLSVDTTLQPSEVTVNYKGWHPVQSVHERESGAWD